MSSVLPEGDVEAQDLQPKVVENFANKVYCRIAKTIVVD